MALDLLKDINVQQGLKELVESAYSMRQDMDSRVETSLSIN